MEVIRIKDGNGSRQVLALSEIESFWLASYLSEVEPTQDGVREAFFRTLMNSVSNFDAAF